MRSLSCIRIHVVEQWYQFGDEAEQQRRKLWIDQIQNQSCSEMARL